MTKPVRLDREAEQELEATRWYEDRRVGLGDEFLKSVRETLLLLEEMTGVGSPVPGSM